MHRSVICLYLAQERWEAALAQYQKCRDILQRELAIEPEPETQELYAQLRCYLHDHDTMDTRLETDSGA